jgi:hypothetical protein
LQSSISFETQESPCLSNAPSFINWIFTRFCHYLGNLSFNSYQEIQLLLIVIKFKQLFGICQCVLCIGCQLFVFLVPM